MGRKILIFGNGNLAQSLVNQCLNHQYPYHQISRHFRRYSLDFTNPYAADLVINTVGGRLKDDPALLWELNIELNKKLLKEYQAPIVAFSSNAALEPWRSPYASIKKSLETFASTTSRLSVVSVSCLYGSYKTSVSFPGKLRINYPKPIERVFLPANPVQPTPTDWLAEKLLSFSFGMQANFSIAPTPTTYVEFAKKILGSQYEVLEKDFDPLFPRAVLTHGFSTWDELWEQNRI